MDHHSTRETSLDDSGDCVVVVHGLGGKRLWMYPLCHRLRAGGYRVTNWTYNSVLGSIPVHGERLFQYLSETLDRERRIHIVAHSMGSVVVRHALAGRSLSNLARIVLLAPPVQGTPVARLGSQLAMKRIRLLRDLSDASDSLVNQLPGLESLECGTIAGRFDLTVPEPFTRSRVASPHLVLNATHNSLLFLPETARQTMRFLATGQFDHPVGTRRRAS